VQVEDGRPVWNTRYADFMAALGMIPRVCRPYTPQTKGKVERSILVVKTSFWPGVTFGDLDALNEQAIRWSNHRNAKVQRTTGMRPVERIREEPDRKSTRLNSSHVKISYAVFCLKKKNKVT